ncbi:hypothetical protein DN051_32815 [Streptomyces cadmiisoli]|uniref:Uncharacterized protein n=1 Tax=Streptomyces cadmiisoli TaxID=2184053 RepID=A0A2Z4J712_9ACTN|nr:hypothetical protein DN051_32815 [Streptomyces cadmiisoli]
MRPDAPACPLISRHLGAAGRPARIEPARVGGTGRGPRAGPAPVPEAAAPHDGFAPMRRRGETEPCSATSARAQRVLDGDRRPARADVPPRSDS